MKKIETFEKISRKYQLVSMILVLVCISLGVSYSSFTYNINDKRASEMYVAPLSYNIAIDGLSTSILTAVPGMSTHTITIYSANTVRSYYKLAYLTKEKFSIETTKTTDEPFGSIKPSEKKTFDITIVNTSETDINVIFKAFGGYATNSLNSINVDKDYTVVNLYR